MREHRLTPENLLIYRERLKGCFACKNHKYFQDRAFCGVEKKYKIKLGFPDSNKDECRFFWVKR